jgi:hypothetical protein
MGLELGQRLRSAGAAEDNDSGADGAGRNDDDFEPAAAQESYLFDELADPFGFRAAVDARKQPGSNFDHDAFHFG